MSGPVKAAVLLSGSGRTLENFFAKIEAGELPLEIVAVVSSRAGVRGLDIAQQHGVPAASFRRKDYTDKVAHNEAINVWLEDYRPDLIILAGYLSYYIKPAGFGGPIVNIHPALLPKYGGQGYYGDRVHEAVLAARESVTGCTVHLVDEVYDNGQILGQQEVSVMPGDDVAALAARVFAAECELYPAVLARLVADIG
ncbi:MAG: formyltransferase family protein [Candidatus Krumholzibacteria bacterium]|nr:formyltransferase family protein [Candidatus Krumholzibacteria bacterium]